ncbi:hypothetical protein K438DRAFT_1851871 [Mycena galopus ATCC 62051]|nr:hypothetical protein K438DRAFT_1892951 [Mycena galopus ATCC 62051]KAF8171912.1 hypothetical protein K438DRAFT_1851871 [Mycena galopus ATCC 62051]
MDFMVNRCLVVVHHRVRDCSTVDVPRRRGAEASGGPAGSVPRAGRWVKVIF